MSRSIYVFLYFFSTQNLQESNVQQTSIVAFLPVCHVLVSMSGLAARKSRLQINIFGQQGERIIRQKSLKNKPNLEDVNQLKLNKQTEENIFLRIQKPAKQIYGEKKQNKCLRNDKIDFCETIIKKDIQFCHLE